MTFTKINEAWDYVGGLSKPSKMPGYAYSISAQRCVTGGKLQKISGSICEGCYALKGRYRMNPVQQAMERRYQSLGKPYWVDAMSFLINNYAGLNKPAEDRYFRWHDSGDIQDHSHLQKIVQVAENCKDTKFWLPTREYKIISDWVKSGKIFPENLTIRLSALMFGQNLPIKTAEKLGVASSGADVTNYNCPSHKQNNSCASCRKCWDKNEKTIIYKKH